MPCFLTLCQLWLFSKKILGMYRDLNITKKSSYDDFFSDSNKSLRLFQAMNSKQYSLNYERLRSFLSP